MPPPAHADGASPSGQDDSHDEEGTQLGAAAAAPAPDQPRGHGGDFRGGKPAAKPSSIITIVASTNMTRRGPGPQAPLQLRARTRGRTRGPQEDGDDAEPQATSADQRSRRQSGSSSCPHPGRRFTSGDQVMLRSGVTDGNRALSQGQVGTIIQDDRDGTPYVVRGRNGILFQSEFQSIYLRESEVRCPTSGSGGNDDDYDYGDDGHEFIIDDEMRCNPTPFSAALGLLITLSVLGFVATTVMYLTKWGTSAADAARKKGHDSQLHTGLPVPVRGPPLLDAAAPCRPVVRLASREGALRHLRALVPGCRGIIHPLYARSSCCG